MQHLRVNPLSKKICQDHLPRTGTVFRTNGWVSHTISPSPATRPTLTVGLYPNGQPGEIFIRMAKEGSTIAGLMECFGTVVSVSLQHGVPLKVLCDKLSHTRFEPSGWTGNEELGYAKSIMDYLFRWMKLRFLSGKQLPLFTQQMAVVERQGSAEANHAPAGVSQYLHDSYEVGDAPLCVTCGSLMVRSGSCHKCANCGGTSGCS
jgi:ribonucleoside-diphosphate reductase alpha chain